MKPTRPLVAAAAVAALALSGCGSHGAAVASAQARAQLAAGALAATTASLRFEVTVHVTVDPSKLTGGRRGALGAFPTAFDLNVSGDQENANRQRATVSYTAGGRSGHFTVVRYDGQVFYAQDGTHFATVSPRRSAREAGAPVLGGGKGLDLGAVTSYLEQLPGIQDRGATQQDGVAVEKYEATLDDAFLAKLLAGVLARSTTAAGESGSGLGALPGALIQGLLTRVVHLDNGTADLYVRSSDGRLDRATLALPVTLDLGRLGLVLGAVDGVAGKGHPPGGSLPAPLLGGQLSIRLALDAHLFDYSSSITITKPTVDPNAPSPPGFGL